MPIQVSVGGHVFNADDFTLNEAIEVEQKIGLTWLALNPFHSAAACQAIMVVGLKRFMSEAEAEAIVGDLTVDQAIECLERVEDDLPTDYSKDGIPKAEAGTGTNGSSGPTKPVAGLPQ